MLYASYIVIITGLVLGCRHSANSSCPDLQGVNNGNMTEPMLLSMVGNIEECDETLQVKMLCYASRKYFNRFVSRLLNSVKNKTVDRQCDDKLSSLQSACKNFRQFKDDWLASALTRQVKTVGALLKKGADPNKFTLTGFTCIHYAVQRGSKELLQMLLDHGGNPNLTTTKGTNSTVFDLALNIDQNEKAIILLLLNASAKPVTNTDRHSLLEYSLKNNMINLTRMLLKRGANTSYRNSFTNQTLLHMAIDRKNQAAAFMFIKYGAPINAIDTQGRTALHLAVESHKNTTAQLLLQHGANRCQGDVNGLLPLHYCILYCAYNICNMLLTNCSDKTLQQQLTYYKINKLRMNATMFAQSPSRNYCEAHSNIERLLKKAESNLMARNYSTAVFARALRNRLRAKTNLTNRQNPKKPSSAMVISTAYTQYAGSKSPSTTKFTSPMIGMSTKDILAAKPSVISVIPKKPVFDDEYSTQVYVDVLSKQLENGTRNANEIINNASHTLAHAFACSDNVAGLALLKKYNVLLDLKDKQGNTPFQLAALCCMRNGAIATTDNIEPDDILKWIQHKNKNNLTALELAKFCINGSLYTTLEQTQRIITHNKEKSDNEVRNLFIWIPVAFIAHLAAIGAGMFIRWLYLTFVIMQQSDDESSDNTNSSDKADVVVNLSHNTDKDADNAENTLPNSDEDASTAGSTFRPVPMCEPRAKVCSVSVDVDSATASSDIEMSSGMENLINAPHYHLLPENALEVILRLTREG